MNDRNWYFDFEMVPVYGVARFLTISLRIRSSSGGSIFDEPNRGLSSLAKHFSSPADSVRGFVFSVPLWLLLLLMVLLLFSAFLCCTSGDEDSSLFDFVFSVS